MVAGAICVFLTPLLIRLLRRLEYGQVIREDGPHAHFVKTGTPTMGGILIVFGTVVGFMIFSRWTVEGLIVLGTIAFLYFARPVVLPVVVACVAGMTLKPLIRWLVCCHIPPAVSAAVARRRKMIRS